MTMPRVVCPSPVSSVDGNQSIGTLTHAGCRNTVVFSSASGGAGTSVFAAMVAWRLAQRKLQCALVDCDFAAGGIDVLLGILTTIVTLLILERLLLRTEWAKHFMAQYAKNI